MLSEIFAVLGQTLSIYSFILIIRILLTWFPGIDWSNGVLSALTSITDPYLNIFRGIIPPIGGFDISSLLANKDEISNPPIGGIIPLKIFK